MDPALRVFADGGPTIQWLEYLAIPAALVALACVVKPQAWSVFATVVMITALLGIGGYGTRSNFQDLDAVIAKWTRESDMSPPPSFQQERARAAHARKPIELAGAVAGGLVVMLLLAGLRHRVRVAR